MAAGTSSACCEGGRRLHRLEVPARTERRAVRALASSRIATPTWRGVSVTTVARTSSISSDTAAGRNRVDEPSQRPACSHSPRGALS